MHDRLDEFPSPDYSPIVLDEEDLEDIAVENVTSVRPLKVQRTDTAGEGFRSSFLNRDTTSTGMDYGETNRSYDVQERSTVSHGVTVVMGDTTTRNLTSLTVAALDTFRNQCREARKNNNHTFSRAKHIPLDSRVRAGINFIFRTNNLIQELDRDVWDAWDDDTFFTTLRPLVARSE